MNKKLTKLQDAASYFAKSDSDSSELDGGDKKASKTIDLGDQFKKKCNTTIKDTKKIINEFFEKFVEEGLMSINNKDFSGAFETIKRIEQFQKIMHRYLDK